MPKSGETCAFPSGWWSLLTFAKPLSLLTSQLTSTPPHLCCHLFPPTTCCLTLTSFCRFLPRYRLPENYHLISLMALLEILEVVSNHMGDFFFLFFHILPLFFLFRKRGELRSPGKCAVTFSQSHPPLLLLIKPPLFLAVPLLVMSQLRWLHCFCFQAAET